MCGRNPISLKALTLSLRVRPCSDPATSAMYTDFGSRFFARRCASATVSNHSLLLAISTPAAVVAGLILAAPGQAGRAPSQAHTHGLDLCVQVEDLMAHFAAPPGLLVAAEGQCGVEDVVAVVSD